LLFCALRAKQKTKNKKQKENIRPQAAKNDSGCCGFSRPIRASPPMKKDGSHARRDAGQGSWYRMYLTIRGRQRIFSARQRPAGVTAAGWPEGRAKRVTAGTRARGVRKGIPPLAWSAGAARKRPSRSDGETSPPGLA